MLSDYKFNALKKKSYFPNQQIYFHWCQRFWQLFSRQSIMLSYLLEAARDLSAFFFSFPKRVGLLLGELSADADTSWSNEDGPHWAAGYKHIHGECLVSLCSKRLDLSLSLYASTVLYPTRLYCRHSLTLLSIKNTKLKASSILMLEWLFHPNHMNKWNIWRKWAIRHRSGYVLVFTLLAAWHVVRRRWRKSQACVGQHAGQMDKKRTWIEHINRNRKGTVGLEEGGGRAGLQVYLWQAV